MNPVSGLSLKFVRSDNRTAPAPRTVNDPTERSGDDAALVSAEHKRAPLVIPLRAADSRGDDPSADVIHYDRVPVSEFGVAMLRGMGWSADKQNVGLTNAANIDPDKLRIVARPDRRGLGADTSTPLPPSHKRSAQPVLAPPEKKQRGSYTDRHWARRHIRVRIVSRSYRGGQYYSQTGTVSAVADDGADAVTIRLDNGDTVRDAQHRHIESVIPKRTGETVMILRGLLRGQTATLIGTDPNAETADIEVINDNDKTVEHVVMRYDDIAHYTT